MRQILKVVFSWSSIDIILRWFITLYSFFSISNSKFQSGNVCCKSFSVQQAQDKQARWEAAVEWFQRECHLHILFTEKGQGVCSKLFADVTLASEDGQQVEAHKVILPASSPFFLKLLRRNKHSHPLIYMRGLQSEHLVAMIGFLFFGEANIQESYNKHPPKKKPQRLRQEKNNSQQTPNCCSIKFCG